MSIYVHIKRNTLIDTEIQRRILNMWTFSSGKSVGMPKDQR